MLNLSHLIYNVFVNIYVLKNIFVNIKFKIYKKLHKMGNEMNKIIVLPPSKQSYLLEYMPKETTLEKLASFFSAFSDSTRIKILTALCLSEMCVNDISALLKINQTTVSHQLRFLKQNGAVKCKRSGKLIYYSIADNSINEVMLNGVNYLLGN